MTRDLRFCTIRPLPIPVLLVCGRTQHMLNRFQQIQPMLEDAHGDWLCGLAFYTFRGGIEKFQITAVVEDRKRRLVLTWPEQIRTQPRTTANHLQKFGLGTIGNRKLGSS